MLCLHLLVILQHATLQLNAPCHANSFVCMSCTQPLHLAAAFWPLPPHQSILIPIPP